MRVMFVCRKNSCRSQMAEGFAHALHQGKLSKISSAGLVKSKVHPLAIQVMAEAGIDIRSQASKLINDFNPQDYDAVASMCGCGGSLPEDWLMRDIFQEWDVADPEERSIVVFRQVREQVREQVEALLMLIALKRQSQSSPES